MQYPQYIAVQSKDFARVHVADILDTRGRPVASIMQTYVKDGPQFSSWFNAYAFAPGLPSQFVNIAHAYGVAETVESYHRAIARRDQPADVRVVAALTASFGTIVPCNAIVEIEAAGLLVYSDSGQPHRVQRLTRTHLNGHGMKYDGPAIRCDLENVSTWTLILPIAVARQLGVAEFPGRSIDLS